MTPAASAIVEILMWGIVATLGMNAVMFTSQNLGWSRLNMPLLLGTFFTEERNAANTLGFFLYLLFGWLIAFFYYLIFAMIGAAGWWRGTLVGFGHGVLVLTAILPLLAYMHPRVASEYDGPTVTRRLEPPGFLALHYGRNTPLVTLIAHVVYGTILGAGFTI
jgi:uncharacterized membrane protein YagU involved in acid resistance